MAQWGKYLPPEHDKLSFVSSIHIKAEPGSMSCNPRDRRVKTGDSLGLPGAPWGSLGLLISMREAVSKNMVKYLGRCIVLTFGLYMHTYKGTLGHTQL